jgi:hypothetical protein
MTSATASFASASRAGSIRGAVFDRRVADLVRQQMIDNEQISERCRSRLADFLADPVGRHHFVIVGPAVKIEVGGENENNPDYVFDCTEGEW